MTNNKNNNAPNAAQSCPVTPDLESIRRETRKAKLSLAIRFIPSLILLLLIGAGAIYEHQRYVEQLRRAEETSRKLDRCLQDQRDLLKQMKENRLKTRQLIELRKAVTH